MNTINARFQENAVSLWLRGSLSKKCMTLEHLLYAMWQIFILLFHKHCRSTPHACEVLKLKLDLLAMIVAMQIKIAMFFFLFFPLKLFSYQTNSPCSGGIQLTHALTFWKNCQCWHNVDEHTLDEPLWICHKSLTVFVREMWLFQCAFISTFH